MELPVGRTEEVVGKSMSMVWCCAVACKARVTRSTVPAKRPSWVWPIFELFFVSKGSCIMALRLKPSLPVEIFVRWAFLRHRRVIDSMSLGTQADAAQPSLYNICMYHTLLKKSCAVQHLQWSPLANNIVDAWCLVRMEVSDNDTCMEVSDNDNTHAFFLYTHMHGGVWQR